MFNYTIKFIESIIFFSLIEPQGSIPPRISERASRMVGAVGSKIMLPCVAQGHPPPQYT